MSSTLIIGFRAACPRPQIDVSRRTSCSAGSLAREARSPASINFTACSVPIRQGTHLPQDSLRKKVVRFCASSTRFRPLLTTITAPDPSALPTFCNASNVMGMSACSALKKPVLAPPGKNARSSPPSLIPPARSTSWRSVVPIGTSNTPGCSTSPLTEKNLRLVSAVVRVRGTWANVSTLLMRVGFP